jgi:hypothetical protein
MRRPIHPPGSRRDHHVVAIHRRSESGPATIEKPLAGGCRNGPVESPRVTSDKCLVKVLPLMYLFAPRPQRSLPPGGTGLNLWHAARGGSRTLRMVRRTRCDLVRHGIL